MKIEWTDEAIEAAERMYDMLANMETILDAAAEIQFKDAISVVDETNMVDVYMMMKTGEISNGDRD